MAYWKRNAREISTKNAEFDFENKVQSFEEVWMFDPLKKFKENLPKV